jgi:hypothetical protein
MKHVKTMSKPVVAAQTAPFTLKGLICKESLTDLQAFWLVAAIDSKLQT